MLHFIIDYQEVLILVIGQVFKDINQGDMTIKNVAYSKMNHPCKDGCCENELYIKGREIYRTGWLIKYYMKDNGVRAFDLKVDWTDSVEKEFQIYLDSRKRKE